MVVVRFDHTDGELRVVVADDGVGVPEGGPASEPGHLGLRTMTERAQTIGAACTVARRSGGGTEVVLTVAREVVAPEATPPQV